MELFSHLKHYGYGDVHLHRDHDSGLRAIVAIHDTRLGPALGGCRFLEYETDDAALVDALRLARGMTYKAALAGIAHGGGKSVLIRPDRRFDRTALYKAFGRFVESLGGRYITAVDSGSNLEDMDVIRSETTHVTGVSPTQGGSGDPSPLTALGVRRGIEACVKFALDASSLDGMRVAVQGVGHVGYHLCAELHEQGAELTVADVDPLKAERAQRDFGARVVGLDEIYSVDCNVFAPCALGSAINDQTIPQLKCRIVAGAANNQLAKTSMGEDLRLRGILYAPDYAINAGGLINVAQEVTGYDADKARERTLKIYETIYEVAERAETAEMATNRVANRMVEERLAKAGPAARSLPPAAHE